MPSQAKEKGLVVWDFKGEVGSSHGDVLKSTCLINKGLLGPAETMGHRVDSDF